MISNRQDVYAYFSADTEAECERCLYRNTECGAWIQFLDNGVLLGSIVEGSDAEVDTDPLVYPFSEEDLQMTIDYIEGEVSVLWDEANKP